MTDKLSALLPLAHWPFETALVDATSAPLPAPIREAFDPWQCPEELLPFLAHAWGVDLWRDSWPTSTKRRVIAHAVDHHRHKGCDFTLRAYTEIWGGEVLKITRPSEKIFASRSRTKAEREAWLDRLPQIRIGVLRVRAQARKGCFASGTGSPVFTIGRFYRPSVAVEHFGPRAVWWDAGQETPVHVAIDPERGYRTVTINTVRRHLFVARGRPVAKRQLRPSTAPERLYTISTVPVGVLPFRTPLRPSVTPTLVEPERTSSQGVDRRNVLANALPRRKKFFLPTRSAERIYDRICVFDASRVPPVHGAMSFWSISRLGCRPHQAEVLTGIPATTTKLAMFAAARRVGSFCLPARGWERVRGMARAQRAAKRKSDTLLMDTKTYRPLSIGQTLLLGGALKLGQWTRS